MAFFLIVPSVIIISIILIHGVANYLEMKISYGALFICAALSFVALFGAIELSPNPDKYFFVHLGEMILPAALIVTLINKFLVQSDDYQEEDFTEEVRRAYAQQSEENPSSSEIAKDRLKKVSAQVYTLEELLEYAQAEKLRGNIDAAIEAYQKALEEYPADDYAPFVAIDLSAIYREMAAYEEAIKVYEDALTLPAVKKNSAVVAEFRKKLAYIKTVQSVLLRHRALATPFSKISKEHLREIEAEFKEISSTENPKN